MKFVEYPDREMMMIELANILAGALTERLMGHETASLAVPGGTTPGPVFDALCAIDIDWSRVNIMLTDERWVPDHSERSNTALIRRRLLTGPAAAANFIPFYDGSDTPEEAVVSLEKTVAPALPLSLLLLGMGGDLHTASLFPGADRLAEGLSKSAPPVLPMRAPGAPEARMTLTAPILQGAMATHVLITGSEKRDALENVDGMSVEEAPIKLILNQATVHWSA
ncbi:MAG: 6-phosphogluconolactonase [Litoreibacter sp.]